MPGTSLIPAKYRSCFEDPRSAHPFPGDAYPSERDSGAAAPENVQEAKRRFCAVYARRNACVRDLSSLEPGDPHRRALGEQIVTLTEAIDYLEDFYAPIGFIAEPVMDDTMFATELVFTHAPLPSRREPCESSFSFYIPIPLDDFKGKEGGDGA